MRCRYEKYDILYSGGCIGTVKRDGKYRINIYPGGVAGCFEGTVSYKTIDAAIKAARKLAANLDGENEGRNTPAGKL